MFYEVLICFSALVFLMAVAYRGHSVILFAPVAALGAVFLTDPHLVFPVFSGVFMEKMVGFLKLYFPVFLLGALFGKMIEISGFSRLIVRAVIGLMGGEKAILAIVAVCALLTYGGVSLFVVVFAVFPFAAELFRQSRIPKRLIPGTIALGAFTFTMDSLPGTPQIQNIIPTTFFNTDAWAAPVLGCVGAIFVLCTGLLYLNWRRRAAQRTGEGYGSEIADQLAGRELSSQVSAVGGGETLRGAPTGFNLLRRFPFLAILPLLVVGISNIVLLHLVVRLYGETYVLKLPGLAQPIETKISSIAAVWSVEAALVLGIVTVLLMAYKEVRDKFAEGSKAAVGGALLAATNTASEYGFGAVISSLPGFLVIGDVLKKIPNPLINEAITVTSLAGITGSASGGMSIALAAMAEQFKTLADGAGIPYQVLHRVAAMASGGMDTLPHNGAVITLLAVTGLSHRESYKDIFAITCIKTGAVFVVIAFYYLTGLV
jgi:H+/gluconate symporter-like permease